MAHTNARKKRPRWIVFSTLAAAQARSAQEMERRFGPDPDRKTLYWWPISHNPATLRAAIEIDLAEPEDVDQFSPADLAEAKTEAAAEAAQDKDDRRLDERDRPRDESDDIEEDTD